MYGQYDIIICVFGQFFIIEVMIGYINFWNSNECECIEINIKSNPFQGITNEYKHKFGIQ